MIANLVMIKQHKDDRSVLESLLTQVILQVQERE
jgi:hypothetical protein